MKKLLRHFFFLFFCFFCFFTSPQSSTSISATCKGRRTCIPRKLLRVCLTDITLCFLSLHLFQLSTELPDTTATNSSANSMEMGMFRSLCYPPRSKSDTRAARACSVRSSSRVRRPSLGFFSLHSFVWVVMQMP
jgi:hypothetical protein